MTKPSTKIGAVIVAAGASNRMCGVDKIFAEPEGKPLIAIVIDVFQHCASIDTIVIVMAEKYLERGQKLARDHGWSKVVSVCAGGERRQDSVKEGLQRLNGCEWVIIHDGARPCITSDIIERGLISARKTGAAIAAVPVKDTIKTVSPQGSIQGTLERQSLWIAQTPQIFKYSVILEAYNHSNDNVTDDASLVERMGHKVEVFMGSYHNIKVTTYEDLAIARSFLYNGENTHSGSGEICAQESATMPTG